MTVPRWSFNNMNIKLFIIIKHCNIKTNHKTKLKTDHNNIIKKAVVIPDYKTGSPSENAAVIISNGSEQQKCLFVFK